MIDLRWLYAGLVLAILGNLAIIPIAWPYAAGNLTAVVICAMVLWLLRHRDRFRP